MKQQHTITGYVPEYLFIKSGYEQYKILLDDILYLESAGNYVNFVLKDRKLLSRISMQEALALLLSDAVHQGTPLFYCSK